MDIFFTVIGIILAARLISFPVSAFLPVAGNMFFLCVVFIGVWRIFSPTSAIVVFLGAFFVLWAIGSQTTSS